MITKEQAHVISKIFTEFNKKDQENKKWTKFDDAMAAYHPLSNEQIFTAADAILTDLHKKDLINIFATSTKCTFTFPELLDSMELILILFQENKTFTPRTRFMVEYFIALEKTQDLYLL